MLVYKFVHGRHKLQTAFVSLLLVFASLGLHGCGGGSDSAAGGGNGEVLIALTDAEGDFVSYTVDVLSIKLMHASGTEVETLPLKTRVDFAQYTNLTEFLTATSVPNGRYVKGSIILDYSNADIWVEDATGNAQQATTIVDENGDPITTLEVNVTLEGRAALPVAPGIPKNLMLDFDLEQSNSVVFANSGVTVTVQPVLIAEVDPQAPKLHRIRGPLRQVDVADNNFEIYIRPFYHRLRSGQRIFGTVKVLVNADTIYEIDGVTYSGSDGLDVLALESQYTAVIATGDLKFNPLRFAAREVYAGTSVPGGELDVVRGTVTERDQNNNIMVRGATLFRTDGSIVFNDTVTVKLDASTTVVKQLNTGTFDIGDISVGQRITLFGTVTNDQVSDLQMDASNGFARMRLSDVKGNVVNLPDQSSSLALNLSAINGRSIDIYKFDGTGTPGNDADKTFYEIDSTTLSLDTVSLADILRVRGFPSAFATAPADFTAQTIIEYTPAP